MNGNTIGWRSTLIVIAGAGFAACAMNVRADEPPNTASQQFAKLLEDAWEFGLESDPLFATDIGDHRHDDKLPTISLAEEARVNDANREFIRRLEAIDRSQLSAKDQINYDIFGRGKREDLQEFDFQTYLMPVSDRSGFHIELSRATAQPDVCDDPRLRKLHRSAPWFHCLCRRQHGSDARGRSARNDRAGGDHAEVQ